MVRYLLRMILRQTNTIKNTAVSILGSTIYESEKNNEPIIVYLGQSAGNVKSSAQGILDGCTITSGQSSAAVFIPSKQWDDGNLNFTSCFKMGTVPADVMTIRDFNGRCNQFFGVTWTADSIRSNNYWSADSNYVGSTILGTFTMYLPSAEIMGIQSTHVRSQVIEYLTSSNYFKYFRFTPVTFP